MKHLINVPIEPIENRYSAQWDSWFVQEFPKQFKDTHIHTFHGHKTSGVIANGSFLDVAETNMYKNTQLTKILKLLSCFSIKDEVTLFFHDLWYPGIEMIAYIRDGLGWDNLKITGCLHAGSYDPFDFLAKRKMTPWAAHFENSIFTLVDLIFVATDFHKELLLSTRKVPFSKIQVTGFPIYPEKQEAPKTRGDGRTLIVFPHRLDSEKRPEMFDSLMEMLDPTLFVGIKTAEVCKTKAEYYQALSEAHIAVSFALQETWGIAMQEAVFHGCIPLVPNRLSYEEMYPSEFKYDSLSQLILQIEAYAKNPPKAAHWKLSQELEEKGAVAISNISNLISTAL